MTGAGANKEYLKAYGGLYFTKDTGFRYALPYLEAQVENIGASWATMNGLFEGIESDTPGATTSSQKLAGILNKIGGGGQDDLTKLLSNIAGSAYNEKPRSYAYDAQFSFNVRFPLYNTINWDHTKKNFEFVTLLAYQNLPNRLDPTLLDPPVIYEAYVPGIMYTPYCFLSNLSIKSVGATREMKMPLTITGSNPGIKPTRTVGGSVSESNDVVLISALIPDAYEVELTITSLVGKSQNLKYQALMSGDSNDGFSVGLPTGFTSAVKSKLQQAGVAG